MAYIRTCGGKIDSSVFFTSRDPIFLKTEKMGHSVKCVAGKGGDEIFKPSLNKNGK
jgi:hypothetical protein